MSLNEENKNKIKGIMKKIKETIDEDSRINNTYLTLIFTNLMNVNKEDLEARIESFEKLEVMFAQTDEAEFYTGNLQYYRELYNLIETAENLVEIVKKESQK